jgi:hypothetical protein
MNAIDGYGIGCLGLILVVFYFVRKIPAYVACSAGTSALFTALTLRDVDFANPSQWLVMLAGLLVCAFGLLIVRVMLIRSVSLNLLRSIDGMSQDRFGDDIGGRLDDMRSFRLIRTAEDANALTAFGRFVGGVVATLYALFRIKA